LQRRHGHIALAEGGVVGVASRPALAVVAALPLALWHTPGQLAGKLNTQFGADAERRRPAVQVEDAQPARTQRQRADVRIAAADLVEIHVAALRDPFEHVHALVPAAQPADERLPPADIERRVLVRQDQPARTEQECLRRNDALLQRPDGGDHLPDRAGRVKGTDGVIDQRAQQAVKLLEVVFAVNGAGKARIVVSRPADHRQHLTIARVHGDDHALLSDQALRFGVDDVDPPRDCFLGDFLQSQVERKLHALARHALDLINQRQALAGHVHDPGFSAARPGQLRLEVRLNARVADAIKGRVIAQFAQAQLLFRANRPQVADHVRRRRAGGILAHRRHLHRYARQQFRLL